MKKAGEGSRPQRVGERIRQELMAMLMRGAVKDPGVQGAIVHGVEVSGDLRLARVFVRLTEPDADAKRQRALLKGLDRAGGFLRRELGSRLGLKHTPDLSFVWDDTAERATRVETLLDEIRAEESSGGDEP